MKRQIRRGCFETNSSSQHVLVVTKYDTHLKEEDFNQIPEQVWIEDDGTLHVAWQEEDLEFGRAPFDILATFKDKLRYVIAEYCGYKHYNEAHEELQKIIEAVQHILPNVKSFQLPDAPHEIVLDQDGKELPDGEVHYESKIGDYYVKDGQKIPANCTGTYRKVQYFGYVDHASVGLVKNYIDNNNITLEEFLTNHKYLIVIDGDEYCVWDNCKYSGLFDINAIKEEYGEGDEYKSYLKWQEEHPDPEDDDDEEN